MPEEGDLLFQRALRVDHAPCPEDGATSDHPLPFGKIPFQHIHVDTIWLVFGMQKFLDRRLVPLGGPCLQLFVGRAKSGTAHQVSHQSNIVLCHTLSLHTAIISGTLSDLSCRNTIRQSLSLLPASMALFLVITPHFRGAFQAPHRALTPARQRCANSSSRARSPTSSQVRTAFRTCDTATSAAQRWKIGSSWPRRCNTQLITRLRTSCA